MKIAVDCDDVLADSINLLKSAYNQRFEDKITQELSPIWQQWHQRLGKERTERLIEIFWDPLFLSSVKPMKDAVKGIEKLTSQQIEIVVITSRSSSTKKATQEWIKTHFKSQIKTIVHHQGKHFTSTIKKAETCQQLGVSLLIEDNPIFIEEARALKLKTIIFNQPWNKHLSESSEIKRVLNWDELVELVIRIK